MVARWHTNRTSEGTYLRYALANVGLGPAILREFSLTAPDFHRHDQTVTLIEELLATILRPLGVRYEITKQAEPSPGYCIAEKEEYIVGEVFLPKPSRSDEVRTQQLLKSIVLRLRCSSLYGDEVPFSDEHAEAERLHSNALRRGQDRNHPVQEDENPSRR